MKKLRIKIYPKSDLELLWRVRRSDFDNGSPEALTCMRCGAPMRRQLSENALSRAMDVHICPACGMDEALRDAADDVLPVSEWYIVKHHYFGEHDTPNSAVLVPTCSFEDIYSGPKKKLPLSCLDYPVSLVAYSRSDYDGRQWWTTWFTDETARPEKELAKEIDAFQDALLGLPEFQTLWDMKRMCKSYAQRTSDRTEFHLYSQTEHFNIWLRMVTREKDYNLYVYYYLRD